MTNFQGVNSNGQLPQQLAVAVRRQNAVPNPIESAVTNNENIEQGGKSLPPVAVTTNQQESASSEQVQKAVTKLSDFVQSVQRDLSFTVNDATGETIITVIDSQTDEVVRQIPSEYVVKLAQNLLELQEAFGNSNSSKGNLLEIRV